MSIQGQLSLLDLVPRSCAHCGYEVSPDDPYRYRSISRSHAEVGPGVCSEMHRWKRNYLQASWGLKHWDEWFDIAPPGSDRYEVQLQGRREDVEHCKRKSIEYFGEGTVKSWTVS